MQRAWQGMCVCLQHPCPRAAEGFRELLPRRTFHPGRPGAGQAAFAGPGRVRAGGNGVLSEICREAWDGEGDAGSRVMPWAEECGAGCGGRWDEWGWRDGKAGEQRVYSGKGGAQLSRCGDNHRNHTGNYMRSDKPSLRHSHNTMGRCYCDHPCFRNRHRGTERLSNLPGSV